MGLFVVPALLISFALYLVLEMDMPSTGLFYVAGAPFQRALDVMQR